MSLFQGPQGPQGPPGPLGEIGHKVGLIFTPNSFPLALRVAGLREEYMCRGASFHTWGHMRKDFPQV